MAAPADPFPADEAASAEDNEPVETPTWSDSVEAPAEPTAHSAESTSEEAAADEEFDRAEQESKSDPA
ncbi:hypothetical protein DNX69_21610 [Rhodopseudomonas palustris]|uniref:Uncharacterized protein n=1 Tax=Rhodopseudomonas palustris TaxID=1076 RepID=A0A323UG89_RHOPL|nr:hypothetical protein DNX69_21610 [Rhodopseudomonas palustris]